MQNKNICKFIQPSFSDPLTVSCFVLETEAEVMRHSRSMKEHRVMLVTQGEGVAEVDGCALPLSLGKLLFVLRGETLSVRGEGLAYMYISFGGGRAEELLRRFDIRAGHRAFDGMDGLLPLWNESLSRASAETVDLASESILLYTFSRLFGTGAESNRLVNRIVALTEERFTDPACSIAVIAEALCYHPKYYPN